MFLGLVVLAGTSVPPRLPRTLNLIERTDLAVALSTVLYRVGHPLFHAQTVPGSPAMFSRRAPGGLRRLLLRDSPAH